MKTQVQQISECIIENNVGFSTYVCIVQEKDGIDKDQTETIYL